MTKLYILFGFCYHVSICLESYNNEDIANNDNYINPYYYQWMEIDPYHLAFSKNTANIR